MVNKPNLLTVRASFLQIKHRNSELDGELQQDIKIKVRNDKKQSTISTILHPSTEVGGQQAKLLTLSILSPDKTKKR